jgi:hypothetical protein
MNNSHFFATICLAILACAPACKKEQAATTPQEEEIRTTIELDNTIIEIEEDVTTKKSIAKF